MKRSGGWRAAARKLAAIVRWAAAGFTGIFLAIHVTPIVPWTAQWLADDWRGTEGEVLIVLAADQLGDGTLGIGSYWRSVYAVRAFRANGYRAVVVSGRTSDGEPSLAKEMREFLAAQGVPRERIVLEERSRTTRENALYTASLVRNWPGRKVLITSDFHMRRARRCFLKAGLEVQPAPFPDVLKRFNSPLHRWECAWAVVQELIKLGYYRLRGWI